MRFLAFSALVISALSFGTEINNRLGTLLATPEFQQLQADALAELKAEEMKSYYFFDSVDASAKALLPGIVFKSGVAVKDITDDQMAEFKAQAEAVAKLRVAKSFNYDRLSVVSYEVSKDDDSIKVTLQREDMHHYPPQFNDFKTIQADLKDGIGDMKLVISNVRVVATAACAEEVPYRLGAVLTESAFVTLLAKTTEELKAEERKSFDFDSQIKLEEKKALAQLLPPNQFLTEEAIEELKVQAAAIAKLRAEKSFGFDRLVLSSFKIPKDEDSIAIVIDREDVHQWPPSFKAFKTIQAVLKRGYGDFPLEVSNIR